MKTLLSVPSVTHLNEVVDPCEHVFVYWFNIWIAHKLDFECWPFAAERGGCEVNDFGGIFNNYFLPSDFRFQTWGMYNKFYGIFKVW